MKPAVKMKLFGLRFTLLIAGMLVLTAAVQAQTSSSSAAGATSSQQPQADQQQDSAAAADDSGNEAFHLPAQGDVVPAVSIARDPADLPPSVGNRPARVVHVLLTAQELEGVLDPVMKTTYLYWTFNGKVPGPMIRVRQGDTVEITLKNEGHLVSHSVDLHAVLGPGGGTGLTETKQGASRSFTFKASFPGVFVYHCGTNLAAQHIANGMYGLIVVEPPGGLPPVDREFYVMQGEIYTEEDMGSAGHQKMSLPKLLKETPEYMVFNGASDALTAEHPMHAQVGESVRLFFGVGGPNLISSPHIIGQVLNRVYPLGSFTSPPLTTVQTTMVPPGGATVMEFTPRVPGKYTLVDHALVRVVRGLAGVLEVTGAENPELFHAGPVK